MRRAGQMSGVLAPPLLRQKQTHLALADQIVVSGANFVTGLLIARFLGIAQFGVFTLLWMTVLFTQSLQHAIITSPMLSLGPKLPAAQQADFYGAMLIEQLAFGLLSGILAIAVLLGLGAALGEPGYASVSPALFLAVIFVQFQDFQRRLHFAKGDASRALRSDLTRYGLQALGLVVWLVADVGPLLEHVLYLIAGTALLGTLATARRLPPLPASLACLKTLLPRQRAFSSWLIGAALMQWTTGNYFILMAGLLLGPASVGALKAAQNLLGITHIFFQAADNFLPPRAARALQSKDRAALKTLMTQTLAIGTAITAAAVLALIAAPEFWLQTIFGQTYSGHGGLVVALALAYLLKVAVVPLRHAALALERTRHVFMSSALATLFTLSISYPAIATLGAQGAAWGMAGVQLVMLFSLLTQTKSTPKCSEGAY